MKRIPKATLQRLNRKAFADFQETLRDPNRDWVDVDEKLQDVANLAMALLDVAEVGDVIFTTDDELKVAWVDDFGTGIIQLTSDGLPVKRQWHKAEDGPQGEAVFYESYYKRGGRASHGWVDKTSRKLTQTG